MSGVLDNRSQKHKDGVLREFNSRKTTCNGKGNDLVSFESTEDSCDEENVERVFLLPKRGCRGDVDSDVTPFTRSTKRNVVSSEEGERKDFYVSKLRVQ